MIGTELKGDIGCESPPNHENLPFCRVKRQYSVFSRGNLLHPGQFDQLLLLKKGSQKIVAGQTSEINLNAFKLHPWFLTLKSDDAGRFCLALVFPPDSCLVNANVWPTTLSSMPTISTLTEHLQNSGDIRISHSCKATPFEIRGSNISESVARPPIEFRGPGGKIERRGPLRAKRAEHFQGLEISYGKYCWFTL